MNPEFEIIEVTKENDYQYTQSIVQLEKAVLERMEQEGKNGQLFITGEDGIQEYIDSKNNHVLIAVKGDNLEQIISVAYITQGQVDYTYNDVTKYFKCGSAYQEYVKSKYSRDEFEKMLRLIYIEKICAFKYARDIILSEQGVKEVSKIKETGRNAIFMRLVEQEYNDPQNQFHEKSEIRDNLNKYMSLYMKIIKRKIGMYQDFYWVDLDYIRQNSAQRKLEKSARPSRFDTTMETYDKILHYMKYRNYDMSHCQDISKYFGANTENTVELDTYITHPNSREKGLARILVLEGIKKSLQRLLKTTDSDEFFLVSTLHEDNLSSRYVSEFFGLNDYLFVNRRSGRDRQVHIFKITREDVPHYLNTMEKRIAVLYDYNPNNIKIKNNEKVEILEEQIQYETAELARLNGIEDGTKKRKFAGYIVGKQNKIKLLKEQLSRLKIYGEDEGDLRKKAKPTGTENGADGCIENENCISSDFIQEL